MKRGFTVHWNGPPASCIGEPHTRCERFWNGVYEYHTEVKGWSDIAYSFGICPHNFKFVGRGWDLNQFANGEDEVGADDGPDSQWYSVLAFVGLGEDIPINILYGLEDLIGYGRNTDRCGDLIYPHWAWKNKPCPGPELSKWCAIWNAHPFDKRELPSPRSDIDMMLIINDKTQGGSGAVLHLMGDRTVLVDNTEDFTDLRAAGLPVAKVRPSQFKRYENLRMDVDHPKFP